MKQLLKNDLHNLYFILSICVLPITLFVAYDFLDFYCILLTQVSFHFIRVKLNNYLPFLSMKKSIQIFYIEKLFLSTLYVLVFCFMLVIMNAPQMKFCISLVFISHVFYLLSEFIVPNGYLFSLFGVHSANPITVYGTSCLFLCVIYKENWVIFSRYMNIIIVLCVVCYFMFYFLCDKGISKRVRNSIALSAIMPGLQAWEDAKNKIIQSDNGFFTFVGLLTSTLHVKLLKAFPRFSSYLTLLNKTNIKYIYLIGVLFGLIVNNMWISSFVSLCAVGYIIYFIRMTIKLKRLYYIK